MNKKEPLIEIRKLKKFFPLKKKNIFQRKQFNVRANEDVSFTIYKGETFGLVGESGCGKSTLGRTILQLYKPTSGSALYYGIPLHEFNPQYVLKEIDKLVKYQSDAKNSYDKSLLVDQKVEALKQELKTFESSNSLTDEKNKKTYESLKNKLVRLEEKSKELKKEASRQLREGSRTAGEFILEKDLPTISKLMREDELNSRELYKTKKEAHLARKELDRAKSDILKVEAEVADLKIKANNALKDNHINISLNDQNLIDIVGQKVNGEEFKKIKELLQKYNSETAKLNKLQNKVKALPQEIKCIEQEVDALNKKSVEIKKQLDSYKRKEVLPITERCLDPDYQDKMEKNREYAINLEKLNKHEIRGLRQRMQMIFQDPYSSLDPRMTVGQAISEAVVEHGLFPKGSKELEEYVVNIMAKCGLDHYMIHRYPHQFSGGQRQRIVIARALALQPEFVVCDESVSALDVSIQSQILNLLQDLKEDSELTYLFISHDLSVIKHVSDRIGVMYLGDLVELSASDELYENPLHPYSKSLISAIPTTTQDKKERIILKGDIPSNINPPSGCKFRTRCPIAREICAQKKPELREVSPGHQVACHFYEETKDIV